MNQTLAKFGDLEVDIMSVTKEHGDIHQPLFDVCTSDRVKLVPKEFHDTSTDPLTNLPILSRENFN